MIGLMFLFALLAIYLSLALLPKGRAATIGIISAAAAALLGTQITALAPLAPVAGYAIALAGIAQGLRQILGARLSEGMYRALLGLPPFLLVLGVLLATSMGPA